VTQNTGSAVYVYCLIRSSRRPRLARVPAGVPDGAPPTLHDLGASIWLVASDVPLDVYGPDNLEPRLRDLDWVASVAVAHEAVNDFFARMRGSVVVPMKLLTMFSTEEKAAADVRARRTAVQRAMRHIAGCEEWGIRVTRRPAAAPPDEGHAHPRTGAGFLHARKAARDAAATARAGAAAAARASFTRLKRHAKDVRPQVRGPEPGTNPPVLEAAFLVRVSARARFAAEARRQERTLKQVGAELTLTGPWPAYNFVDTDAVRRRAR
jgi:Gas vesicle synthesis protein GvpL/GvpF